MWKMIENHLHQHRFGDSGWVLGVLGCWGRSCVGSSHQSCSHVPALHSSLSAFSTPTLTSTRWLLSGYPDGVDNPLWHNILTVDSHKQLGFLSRVLFLHGRALKRGGRAASCRLTLNEWNNEAERMCLAVYIMEQMEMAAGHDGKPLFDAETLEKVSKRVTDGFLGYCI